MEKDPNKKHYFEPISLNDAKAAFDKASAQKDYIVVWVEGQNEEIETYSIQSFNLASQTLELKPVGNLISRLAISKFSGKKIYFRLGSGKLQYFAGGVLQHQSDKLGYYNLKIEGSVFKSQQRSNFRLSASKLIKIRFGIPNEGTFQALDVSAGGTSFIVSSDSKDHFEKGTVFENCVLEVKGQTFTIPSCKVAGVWKFGTTESQLKIGISFGKLSDDTENELVKIINSEARTQMIMQQLSEKKKS